MIRTQSGEVAVEQLRAGDLVLTCNGAAKPIVWIGVGRDQVTRANRLSRPIIVKQGALAEGIPSRDLYLTHGHKLYLNGVLIAVEHLVNGRSILWDDSAALVEYYHIELEEHDVVWANGAPAETYYDAGNRALFQNMRPGSAAGTAQPSSAPVVTQGEIVEEVWAALYARSGGVFAEVPVTADADVHLMVAGGRLDPVSAAKGAYVFALERAPDGAVQLRSRSGVPSLLGRSRCEHRQLGMAVRRIVIEAPGTMLCLDPDAPVLMAGGCYPAEDGFCWTDGVLDLPAEIFAAMRGPVTLAVQTSDQGMRYPLAEGAAAVA